MIMKIRCVTWFDNHFYKIEKEDKSIDYLESVTTVLNASPKPFLARWRGDVGNREADLRMYDAAHKGTRIHHACYTYMDGGAVIYNPFESPNYSQEEVKQIQSQHDRETVILQDQDEMWQVVKFQKWIDIVNPTVLGMEQIVYSLEEHSAGSLDYLFQIEQGTYNVAGARPLNLEGGIYVVDLKSSNTFDDDYFIQVAAYSKFVEESDISIQGCLIIHTNSTKTKKGIEGLNTHYLPKDSIPKYWETFKHVHEVWKVKNAGLVPKIFEFPTLLSRKVA